MQLSDFDFNLPPELIAQKPLSKRSDSKLLCLNKETGSISHHYFKDLPKLLSPNDLMILNNTKVIPARLYAKKPSGGKVEIMIERVLGDNKFIAQTKASKSPKIGDKLILTGSPLETCGDDNLKSEWCEVTNRKDNLFEFILHSHKHLNEVLENLGEMPLPPYIRRKSNSSDQENYQTIYAKSSGAVAAPTAGLHFDQKTIANLKQKNIQMEFVTLHVGLGTFQPVRTEKITEHKMHPEHIKISSNTCDKIISTRKKGNKIIAVGTTSVRTLETASQKEFIKPLNGDTSIFIYPGYKFLATDVLITNFHLPKSTLLMLVSAFAGLENIMRAYSDAIKNQYRFYSYGDAMLIY